MIEVVEYAERAWCRATIKRDGMRDVQVKMMMPFSVKKAWGKTELALVRMAANDSFFKMGIGYEDGMDIRIEVRTKRGETKAESKWETLFHSAPEGEEDCDA